MTKTTETLTYSQLCPSPRSQEELQKLAENRKRYSEYLSCSCCPLTFWCLPFTCCLDPCVNLCCLPDPTIDLYVMKRTWEPHNRRDLCIQACSPYPCAAKCDEVFCSRVCKTLRCHFPCSQKISRVEILNRYLLREEGKLKAPAPPAQTIR